MRFELKGKSIVIIGMAGVGKSTSGRLLSKSLRFGFIDLDDYIEEKRRETLQQIIDSEGEGAFLQIEKRAMYEICLNDKVIAPGGSIIYHSDLMDYLKSKSSLVYLYDTFENIETRITGAASRGIVGLKEKTLKQIYDEREPLYRTYADVVICCQGKSGGTINDEILKYLET